MKKLVILNQRKLLITAWLIFILIFIIILSWIILKTVEVQNTGFEDKSLWDWMDLLIVPLLIPIAVFLLTTQSKLNERKLATYKSRKEDLQAYYDRMTELLLKNNLRSALPESEVVTIARTLSLTIPANLDNQQKGDVIKFLYDAGLINQSQIVDLREANFEGTVLVKADLRGCQLNEVYLQGSDFEKTNFYRANLRNSRLQKTNFNSAILFRADLNRAFVNDASLTNAVLKEANLRRSNLSGSDFSEADLTGADFRQADLEKAKFHQATIINTDFRNALNLTRKQLSTAKEIVNVILPDGQTFNQ